MISFDKVFVTPGPGHEFIFRTHGGVFVIPAHAGLGWVGS